MKFKEYPDREMLVMDVAQQIVTDLNMALVGPDRVSIAVPGGTTPAPIFDVLCAADLDWARVDVLLTDERWVPADHARSNAGLLYRHLLMDRAADAHFVPYYVEGMKAKEGAAQTSGLIEQHVPLDVVVLGMGADMHTASLFPGALGLSDAMAADAPHLCAVQAEGQEPRVTLSAAVLNSAVQKHLVIFGDDKRAALDAAMDAQPEDAPISAVVQGATVHWAA
ncbi:6-phosphogluconolactonase [Ascidiaceihabitans donghaensis]|uniref:6-phosphogluconolactonase n=1 Tax=Ascidiaceihabitans donghaensis TaxID=1510460 RepID=A0A2R8BE73_9RHOB|nr:6-phosphogluconolactonase [Ascidiaceihabitans donghaensis]SPH21376.1 6-phosphogluconolactonase [Ascidiaceihabitans donghaensis]